MTHCLRVRMLVTSTVRLESNQKKCDDSTGSVVLVKFRDYNQNICQEQFLCTVKHVVLIEVKPCLVSAI